MKNLFPIIGIAFIAMVTPVKTDAANTAELLKPEPAAESIDASFDTFGTADLSDPDAPVFGVGVGLNGFVTKHFGGGVELVAQNTSYKVFDGINGNLIARYPLGDRLTPYALAGGGYLFERDAWNAHAGGGLELRVTGNASVFADARWVSPLRRAEPDYPFTRFGLRFGF